MRAHPFRYCWFMQPPQYTLWPSTRDRGVVSAQELRPSSHHSERRTFDRPQLEQHRLAVLGSITAGMAHHLRNAIMPALLRVDALSANPHDSDRLRSDLSHVRASLTSLQELATGLRLLAGDPRELMEPATTRLAAWWKDIEPLLHAATTAGTSICADIARTLPQASVPPSLLAQITIALVVNANQWMLGTPSPRIHVTARQHDDTVCLTVRHAGAMPLHGVPHDTADPLRFESPIEVASGTRLTALRELLREHDGDLTMDEFSPWGGAFSIRLRVRHETSRGRTSTVRVRLALSDPRHAAVARMVLSQQGLTEWSPRGGNDVGSEAPQVIVCDAQMLAAIDRTTPPRADTDAPRLIVVGAPPRHAPQREITWISPTALGLLSGALLHAHADFADRRAN